MNAKTATQKSKSNNSDSQSNAVQTFDQGKDQLAKTFSDPFSHFGESSMQLPTKIPVAKIEYLADPQTRTDHPDFQKGRFSINIGEQLDHLECAVIGMKYTRILWPEGFDPKNITRDPLCRSDDGLIPTAGTDCPKTDVTAKIDGQVHPVCVAFQHNGSPSRDQNGRYIPACQFAKWGSKGQAPRCKELFTLAMYEHQLNIPLIFSVKSTGIKHLSDLRMQLINFQREARFKIKHPIAVYAKVMITIQPVQNWYEPVFTLKGKFSPTEIDINVEAYKAMQPELNNMTAEDFAYNNA